MLLVILLVLVASAVTLWAITYFVQPNTFKLIAKKQLTSLTKQDSAIEGRVNWRVFPRPGLHLTHVRIGNLAQFEKKQADYALSVDKLLLNLQIMPLFHGKLVFDQLVLDGFTLKATLDKTKSITQQTSPQKSKTPTKPSQGITLPSRVALKSLLLTHGKIILIQQQEHITLNHVRLEATFPEKNDDQFPIQLKASIKREKSATPIKGSLTYKGLLRLPPLQHINTNLDALELNGQLTLNNFHIGPYDITKTNAHIWYNQNKLELNPLTFSLYNGESVGRLHYNTKIHELNFDQTGTGLDAEPIFQNLLDITPPRLTGQLDFSLHVTTLFNTSEWAKKAKVDANLTVKNGELAYFNLPALTEKATQTMRTLATQNIELIHSTLDHLKPWNLDDFKGSTPFQLFNLQCQTDGSNALQYNLFLETKKLHLKGQGTLDLETKAINAHVLAKITTQDITTQAIQGMLGHGFPLLITGTLEDPMIHADRRTIRHSISNSILPKNIIEPLKNFRKQLKSIPTYVPN
jgi:AsmA protein